MAARKKNVSLGGDELRPFQNVEEAQRAVQTFGEDTEKFLNSPLLKEIREQAEALAALSHQGAITFLGVDETGEFAAQRTEQARKAARAGRGGDERHDEYRKLYDQKMAAYPKRTDRNIKMVKAEVCREFDITLSTLNRALKSRPTQ